ncbi:MAG: GT4 family glycosyltransferase PelF [Cocleimonas sp.]|nr:GT4 family glycosyltransferase PelF [Cocleimonas sp.]
MAQSKKKKTTQKADICLLLEGTYPYVRGGVSSWVHQLIQGLPHYQFSLVFIGASRESYGEMYFEFPPNVCHFEKHFLNEYLTLKKPEEYQLDENILIELKEIYTYLIENRQAPSLDKLANIKLLLRHIEALEIEQFFYSPQVWQLITDSYRRNCPDQPFNDYFWTIRSMHAPTLSLLQIAKNIPTANCYHTISTGYAGVLGMFLKLLTNKPLLLSEHGIYTKERQIDLYQANWIKESNRHFKAGLDDHMNYLRRLWMQFFEGLGRLTYSACLITVTLYEQNRIKQIELGARPEQAIALPNGVKLERFIALRAKRPDTIPPILCLLGRVVPIKDIKTYIRSVGLLCEKMPEAEGWIVGPEEEEEEYAAECHDLVAQLGLEEQVKFLGFQNIDNILPKTGLLTLSSISEGQPLVILEGFAAGVPTLSTDVGSCRELVEGREGEDREIGKAGAIVPLANPQALADAAFELLSNEQSWYSAQAAGIARVEKYYTEQIFLKNYDKLYEKVLSST